MCPTDRGNDPTVVESDETERVDRERGTESSNRDGNGPLHDARWPVDAGTEPTQSVEEGRRSDQGWLSLV
jgi:hypothetical protein